MDRLPGTLRLLAAAEDMHQSASHSRETPLHTAPRRRAVTSIVVSEWRRAGPRRLKHSLDGLALERVGGVTEGRNLGVSGHTVDGADDVTF